MQKDLDEYPDDPLTEIERKKVRRMMESDDRAHWFWTNSRVWLGWVSGAIITAIVIANGGLDVIKKLVTFR